MGSNLAYELASQIDLPLETQIGYHLQGNHYPKPPLSMVGVSYRGEASAPAWAIVEAHHLDAWLPESEL